MAVALSLLDGVRWHGEQVAGERAQALLAALAATDRAVPRRLLIGAVWGDEPPANADKALQVLVSRVRAACGSDSVVRIGEGYRLGLGTDEVDSRLLAHTVAAAVRTLDDDATEAARLAATALRLSAQLQPPAAADGPLAELRREASSARRVAEVVAARADSRIGRHTDALPELEREADQRPGDESLLADLLRSEAATRGPAAALARYERYRERLRDQLGSDPGPALQRLHRDLLAADHPVRAGLRFESTALVGRDADVTRLRGLLAESRVVSIVGPGGIGKTRLAHVLGRVATEPVVRFVELVGVTSPADLEAEVGSALGIRESLSSRRTLEPDRAWDLRGRIAEQLDRAPTLLILDNCEHLVAAVADLVAYLVAVTQDLRVVTTTRAPLAISAERAYPLAVLGLDDATELFRQRAIAARPDVVLPGPVVAELVSAVDGLPLAIELAAAKVRVMSVADIVARLADRFALLRGGDRSAPDRHQTLVAVIEWSWNLLDEPARRALRRLSVFADGFGLDAAEALLGAGALDAVQTLTDQSLLGVRETPGGVRYRMLETVREFGRMHLDAAGDTASATAGQRDWAIGYADRHSRDLWGSGQFGAIDALEWEEGNLADVVHRALSGHDPATVVRILAALGPYWSIRGEHGRMLALGPDVVDVLEGWLPAPGEMDAAQAAVGTALLNMMVSSSEQVERLSGLLAALAAHEPPAPGTPADPWAALVRVVVAAGTDGPHASRQVARLTDDADPRVAAVALQWWSHELENAGDLDGAIAAAERSLALVTDQDGPWVRASMQCLLAHLYLQTGRLDTAVTDAEEALPVLERLGAVDDCQQLRSVLVHAMIASGDLAAAQQELELLERAEIAGGGFRGRLVVQLGRAELDLARGECRAGIRRHLEGLDTLRAVTLPGVRSTGGEPWLLFGEATALTALAHYGTDADEAVARELFASVRDRLRSVLEPGFAHLDFPVSGTVLLALGSWGLLRDTMPVGDAVRLLALAVRFGYSRPMPTLAWERISPVAEQRAPGRLAMLAEEFGERRGPQLLDQARAAVEKLRVG